MAIRHQGIVNLTLSAYVRRAAGQRRLFAKVKEGKRTSLLVWHWLKSAAFRERPCVPAGRRVYAVGDVHGRADLLSKLFARIDDDLKARPAADTVEVFLGDYIDRGPSSREVIDLLIARRTEHTTIFLKGNHEDYALRFLSDPTVLSKWKRIGGLDTILSYGLTPIAPRRPSVAASDRNCARTSHA